MIKKIFNWFAGGFFRKLGSVFVFILIGFLVSLYFHNSDTSFSKFIKRFFQFHYISASTTSVSYSSVQYRVFYYYLDDRGILNENSSSYTSGGTATSLGDDYDFYPYAFNTRLFMGNNTLAANRTYNIMFTYTFSPQNDNFYDDFPKNLSWSITGNTSSSTSGSSEDFIQNYSVRVAPTCSTCVRYRVYLTVTPAKDIKFIQLNMKIKGNQSNDDFKYDFNYFNLPTGSEYISITYNTDEAATAINNQTIIIQDQTNQIINGQNEINDSLNDSDTSEATTEASDFFSNFNDDQHGLSSIVTAPLNSINLMLSDSCVAPHTVFKGQTISFPCGDVLWSRPGASSLKDFLNLCYGGLIAYGLVTSLLNWVNKFKDPDNDRIEVINL